MKKINKPIPIDMDKAVNLTELKKQIKEAVSAFVDKQNEPKKQKKLIH